MIGNDLVDLTTAKKESNWQRAGWLDKLFSPREQLRIFEAICPEVEVWKRWSRKEAAYKAHQRLHNHAPVFNPIRMDTSDPKWVAIGTTQYDVITTQNNNLIHSTATRFDKVEKIAYTILNYSNTTDKTILLNVLAKTFNLETSRLSIVKNEYQIPQLLDHSSQKRIPISISHHGSYIACAWLLDYKKRKK
ncbi:4'-phosphopantetheinyl transferase superfamily protein [Aquimarina sp. W85]|uniref:4'-phosphopantetheinyl transferase family protein n=1 Tax=Aquimarina rhodophyticola TaxID=3342246 RepID=UPI003671D6DA